MDEFEQQAYRQGGRDAIRAREAQARVEELKAQIAAEQKQKQAAGAERAEKPNDPASELGTRMLTALTRGRA